MPFASSGSGTRQPSVNGIGLAPTTVQPPSRSATGFPPSHGADVLPLRPACASWMPGTAPCASTNRAIRASGSAWASLHKPMSSGEMRPRGSTAVASTNTAPAPPTARDPRWTRCQSVARPPGELYWHMGETPMRLRKVTSRRRSGENRCASMAGRGCQSSARGARLGLARAQRLRHLLEPEAMRPEEDEEVVDDVGRFAGDGALVTAHRGHHELGRLLTDLLVAQVFVCVELRRVRACGRIALAVAQHALEPSQRLARRLRRDRRAGDG